jgi:hypothetical protein
MSKPYQKHKKSGLEANKAKWTNAHEILHE